MLVSSSLCLLMWHVGGWRERYGAVSGSSRLMPDFFRWYGNIAAIQFVFAMTAVIIAAAFLRLLPWSRSALRALAYLALLAPVAVAAAWTHHLLMGELPPILLAVSAVGMLMITLLLALPCLLTLRALNRPDIADAFQRS